MVQVDGLLSGFSCSNRPLRRMLWKERDSVLTFVGAQNLEDLGVVDYGTLQATFLHSIRKTDGTDIN